MQFQIEVRPRSTASRTCVVYYQIVADTENAAIEAAMRRFSEQNQDAADYTFQAAAKG